MVAQLDGQPQVIRGVTNRILADSGCEAGAVAKQGRVLVQRRHRQVVDLRALPSTFLTHLLMIREHEGEAGEVDGVAVLAGF